MATWSEELTALEARLGYSFKRRQWLEEAMTHASHAGATRRSARQAANYERLEFLGDRVLGLVIAELLLDRFPDESEGALARRFTDLVRRETLAVVSLGLELGRSVRLPPVEEPSVRSNAGLLADLCEAVIAAIYLDGGLAAAHDFVARGWLPMMNAQIEAPKDPKTALQEWSQARSVALPHYRVVDTSGPPHRPLFTVSVELSGHPAATGAGSSKRVAEIMAATAMLAALNAPEDPA